MGGPSWAFAWTTDAFAEFCRQLVMEAQNIIARTVPNQHPALEVNQPQDVELLFLQPGPSQGFGGSAYSGQSQQR